MMSSKCLEADPQQEHEGAVLVAVRRRDRAPLEIRQAVDVTALDRKAAERCESHSRTDDAGVGDLRPARVRTVAAVGAAIQLVRPCGPAYAYGETNGTGIETRR